MYKKHKWLRRLRHFCSFNQLRQICDLTVCFKTLNLCLIANLAQYKLTGKSFEITYVSYTKRCASCKKPTAQITHLVFADTQCQCFKNQKSYFLPPSKKETVKYSLIARCADTCRFNLKILY